MNDIERGREVVNMTTVQKFITNVFSCWPWHEEDEPYLEAVLARITHLERIEAAWWSHCNCGKTAWDEECPFRCTMFSCCKGIALGGEE